MEAVKNFLLSKTIQGVLVLALGSLFKIHTDSATLTEIINSAITAAGALWAIYGRVTATKKISLF